MGSFGVLKIFGDENKSNIKLINTIDGYATNQKAYLEAFDQSVGFIKVYRSVILMYSIGMN